jgi:DNA polymerase-3 subunit epsilon
MPLPKSGMTGLARLLERARTPNWRIWAEGAPFSTKDALKSRGYKWNGDDSVPPRCWFTEVPDADKDAELSFLRDQIYGTEVEPLTRKIDAYDRFSDRS